jgi:hypothetical protein
MVAAREARKSHLCEVDIRAWLCVTSTSETEEEISAGDDVTTREATPASRNTSKSQHGGEGNTAPLSDLLRPSRAEWVPASSERKVILGYHADALSRRSRCSEFCESWKPTFESVDGVKS